MQAPALLPLCPCTPAQPSSADRTPAFSCFSTRRTLKGPEGLRWKWNCRRAKLVVVKGLEPSGEPGTDPPGCSGWRQQPGQLGLSALIVPGPWPERCANIFTALQHGFPGKNLDQCPQHHRGSYFLLAMYTGWEPMALYQLGFLVIRNYYHLWSS